MLFGERLTIFAAQFGPLDRPQVENALKLAQVVQNAFRIDFLEKIDVPLDRYLLPNGAYDLDLAVEELVVPRGLPTPLILVTSLPFGDKENATNIESFYFAHEYRGSISLVSTHLWNLLQPDAGLQSYILMMLSTEILAHLSGFRCHRETEGCMFDYCGQVRDILRVFEGNGLCKKCELSLMKLLKARVVDSFQVAGVMRMFDRAKGTRRCFLAMPFSPAFQSVYETVSCCVAASDWLVVRADEICRPRHLTDAIFDAILRSDLLIADISGNNPNVFYELGFAHAAGCDIILLCQKRSTAKRRPFDGGSRANIALRHEPGRFEESRPGIGRIGQQGLT